MLKRLALVLAVVAACEARAEESASALVEKVMSAYGGPALPISGEVLKQDGVTYSARRGVEGTILREARWPDYLRVEIDYGGGDRETRLLNGDAGLRDGAPAPAPMVAAMRLQAARLSLPMILQWEAAKLDDLGEFPRENGGPVRRLALSLREGLALFVEIDVETHRILRSAGVMTIQGAEMAFGTTYSEPAAFGDMSWMAKEDQMAMGRDTGWTRIGAVEVMPKSPAD